MNRGLLILTVFILFLIKITAIWFTNFNLFGDEAQYWLWSKNLDYGYFSKPLCCHGLLQHIVLSLERVFFL